MTALVGFNDAATFSDGAGFRLWTPPKVAIVTRRPLLTFYDGAHRPRWLWGKRVELDCHRPVVWDWDRPVMVAVAHVARARPYEHNGRIGYLLERADDTPLALVDAHAWIEAAG